MPLHVVLVEPEIPPNTGNVARSCAATGTILHLVKPLGFSIDDRSLKRAGLDYWPFVHLEIHESLAEFLGRHGDSRLHLATTRGIRRHTEAEFRDGDMLVFGRETAGLPEALLAERREQTLRIPMMEDPRLRSLNLSNSVSIVLFEALRQLDFPRMR